MNKLAQLRYSTGGGFAIFVGSPAYPTHLVRLPAVSFYSLMQTYSAEPLLDELMLKWAERRICRITETLKYNNPGELAAATHGRPFGAAPFS